MKKILIVDDNELNRKLLRIALQAKGYDICEACNGNEAVTEAMDNYPDLIFMDIDMPVKGGIDALTDIRNSSKLKHIPVIALTAYAMKGDKDRLLKEGFDDYISKPVSIESLPEKIERLCSQ